MDPYSILAGCVSSIDFTKLVLAAISEKIYDRVPRGPYKTWVDEITVNYCYYYYCYYYCYYYYYYYYYCYYYYYYYC